MRSALCGACLFLALASSGVAGVGVWTPTPNADAVTVLVGHDGAVVADWGHGSSFLSFQVARSLDHGASWQPSTGPGGVGSSAYQARALALDPAGTIYAGFTTAGNASYFARLFVSRDAGSSWTELLEEFQTQFLDLRVDPFSPQTLYLLDGVGGPARLSRSTDGGAGWTEIDQSIGSVGVLRNVTAMSLDVRAPDHLFAATVLFTTVPWSPATPALYESRDGGTTWTRSGGNLPDAFATVVVDPFASTTIYGGGASGIFRSVDAGATFEPQSAVPATQIVADSIHLGRLYAATSANGVLASSDGGTTWAAFNAGLTNLAVNAIALDTVGGYLYAATSTGVFVYRFPDPGTLVLDAAHPFSVTLSATDQRTGRNGTGVATPMNDLWGYFSIPAITGNPNNPEVFVKMLDGTAINGAYWLFYGGLTDLEYTLTVTETATGRQRTYTKPAGRQCGGSDTAAFAP